MYSKIIDRLDKIAYSRWYWTALIIFGAISLAVALLFQYAFDELPCVLCIQIRLWMSLLVLVSLVGFFSCNLRVIYMLLNISIVGIGAALSERSYQLLGTERGFLFSDCGFTTGLPAWFAIDDWLPALYRIETSCGYTPELLFGITMAEALMAFSVCLLVFSFSVTAASALKNR